MIPHLSERILILAPRGRDAQVAGSILAEARLRSLPCASLDALVEGMAAGAGSWFLAVASVVIVLLALWPFGVIYDWIERKAGLSERARRED